MRRKSARLGELKRNGSLKESNNVHKVTKSSEEKEKLRKISLTEREG